ncbi:hypothetical protein [Spiroplasma eriocheiris]|uniref:Uncharacterized protein n=1 Tax=Spiroplasma eriocheiris TaxID=315358 RepID=A0A0H3XNA6_9MOLU|nr:hypothetical protein [Spiroplasma eriocheiris]AHF58240.1 hypothetical protein SPE_1126 [Spiroplasma eriocheiris CCTCC M 207170]AKM54677.1 hypothetical protein SERIO_v1c11240 [Spiroplasma eriocheiris]
MKNINDKNNKEPLGKDFYIDQTPLDFANLAESKSDADLSLIYGPDRKNKLYIYSLKRLFDNSEKPSLEFGPNIVQIRFINPDDVIITDAYEINDFQIDLKEIPINNPQKQATKYSEIDTKVMVFQNPATISTYDIRVVSIDEPVNNNNLDKLYIIDQYNQPWSNGATITKLANLTLLKDFKTIDGNAVIVKIQKPLPPDTEITGIKIKAPKAIKWGNIKCWGNVDGEYGYPELAIKDKIPFPLLSMPIETEPKLKILQQWLSHQILPWELAKEFLVEKSCLSLINLGKQTEKTTKLFLDKTRITKANVRINYSGQYWKGDRWGCQTLNPHNETKNIIGLNTTSLDHGECRMNSEYTSPDTYDGVELELKDAPVITSLQQVLLDMLTYTYNYKKNFDGADYQNGSPQNAIAKLKAKFEGQKPENVISNILEHWKLENPNYINIKEILILQQIILLLSNYIYSNESINKGLNDDVKLLSPYYFELVSKPEKKDDNYYEFKDCIVILKSEYFDFTDPENIKFKVNNLSTNKIFKLTNNEFSWISISNFLETNDIPSLIPRDITLASGEYGKYFTNLIIPKNKLNEALKLYGSENNLYNKISWINKISNLGTNEIIEFTLQKNITKLNLINISSIDGSGKYDIELKTKNSSIIIKEIDLFTSNNELLSLININL